MATIAKTIKYHLFIEGEEVPVQSIQIQNSSGKGCSMSASIPPHPMCYKLMRGMKVFVFKQINEGDFLLRFRGILMNKVYSKTYNSRELRIECISPDGRLNVLKVAELDSGEIASTGAIDYKFPSLASSSGEQITVNEYVKKITGIKDDEEVEAYINLIVKSKSDPNSKYDNVQNALDVAKSSFNVNDIGISTTFKHKEWSEQADKTIKEWLKDMKVNNSPSESGESNLVDMIRKANNVRKALNDYDIFDKNEKAKVESAALVTSGVAMSTSGAVLGMSVFAVEGETGTYLGVGITPGSQDKSVDVNVPTDTLRTMTEKSIASVYMREVYKLQGDYIGAIKAIIKLAFANLPGVVKKEWFDFDWENSLYALPIVNKNYFAIDLSPSSLTNGHVLLKPLSEMLKRTVDDIVKNSPSGIPVYNIVTQILDVLFYKISVNHTRVDHSIVLHPQMGSYFPPTQNVIFPNMYTSVSYNGNDWANPTRTYMVFQPFMSTTEFTTFLAGTEAGASSVCVAPTEDPNIRSIGEWLAKRVGERNLAKVNNEEKSKPLAERITSDEWQEAVRLSTEAWQEMQKCQTEEEVRCGVFANIVPFSRGYDLEESCAGQITMADWLHGMAKYGTRLCSVTGGDEMDNLLVGMPTIIVDGAYSIYGVVEDLTIMVDGSGAIQTQAMISMPRMVLNNKFDGITEGGLWLGCSEGKAENIGKEVYAKLLGDGAESVYDRCKETRSGKGWSVPAVSDKYSPTANMRICIAHLNNMFSEAENKEEFVKKFRDVREDNTGVITMAHAFDSQNTNDVREYVNSISSPDNDYAVPIPDDANAGAYNSFINIELDLTGKDYVKTWKDMEIYRRLSYIKTSEAKIGSKDITPREMADFITLCQESNIPIDGNTLATATEIIDGYKPPQATDTQILELKNAIKDIKNAKFESFKSLTPEEVDKLKAADRARYLELESKAGAALNERRKLEAEVVEVDKQIEDTYSSMRERGAYTRSSREAIQSALERKKELLTKVEACKEEYNTYYDEIINIQTENRLLKDNARDENTKLKELQDKLMKEKQKEEDLKKVTDFIRNNKSESFMFTYQNGSLVIATGKSPSSPYSKGTYDESVLLIPNTIKNAYDKTFIDLHTGLWLKNGLDSEIARKAMQVFYDARKDCAQNISDLEVDLAAQSKSLESAEENMVRRYTLYNKETVKEADEYIQKNKLQVKNTTSNKELEETYKKYYGKKSEKGE